MIVGVGAIVVTTTLSFMVEPFFVSFNFDTFEIDMKKKNIGIYD